MKLNSLLFRPAVSLAAAFLFTLAGARAVSVDAGRGGTFPAAVSDDISFTSPAQGQTYQSVPAFTGRVRDYGIDTLSSAIEQLDSAGQPVGYVKWSTGEILAHTNSNLLFGGVSHARSWNSLATGSFTLPQVALPAGNYRITTVGTLMVYGYPYTTGTAKVSFRVEPPLTFTDLQGGDTIAITSPANAQTIAPGTTVQVSGEADGDHLEGVVVALGRFGASGEVAELYNWLDQAWEPIAGSIEFRHAKAATGLYRWTSELPPALAAGQYRIAAYGVSGSTVHAATRTDITVGEPEPEPIVIDSPVAGAVSTSTPAFRGTLATPGVDALLGLVVQHDSQGAISGLVHWVNGTVAPYEDASFNIPGIFGQIAWNGQTGPFTMNGPALPAGSYSFVAYGFKGPALVAAGFAAFRIEAPASDPGTPGGPVFPPLDPGTGGEVGPDPELPGGTDPGLPGDGGITSGTGGEEEENYTPTAPVAGTYDGPVLAENSPESCLGHLSLMVTAQGRFTARLIFNGVTARAKGQLIDGESIALGLPHHAVLPGALRLDARFGEGEVLAQFSFDGATFRARLELGRYSARQNPATPLAALTLSAAEITPITDTPYPTGTSSAVLRVSKAGRFTCIGRLADGRRFSTSGIIHPGYAGMDHFSFAVRPARTRDSLAVANGQLENFGTGANAMMAATWDRAANARARQYAEGFCLDLAFESAR